MKTEFAYTIEQLQQLAEETVRAARAQGADEASVHLAEHIGLNVNVRHAQAEQSEYAHDKHLTLSVRLQGKMGTASTSDLLPKSIQTTLAAALDFARYTSPDPFAGLPDADWLAKDARELDVFHPWALSMAEATELAQKCEALALDYDPRLTNSDGCSLSTGMGQSVLAHSLGFNQGLRSSHHSLGCALIAENQAGMQRDGWYEDSREPLLGVMFDRVAQQSAERTLRRLSPRRVATGKFPVIFDASMTPSLIQALVRAVSGGALYRQASFMLDSLGKKVLPEFLTIQEDPFIMKGLASKPFDEEGVRVSQRDWIDRGVMSGYFLSSYSARKLGMKSTGHAGGAHNLRLIDHRQQNRQGAPDPAYTQQALIKNIKQGMLVTELMGQGVNGLTGDYSRGAVGFWIENGEIAYPVEEVTIAGNLKTMFTQIEAMSSDTLTRGGMECGALWLNELTIAGA